MVEKLDSFYVIPGYTFFYWGFTLPKKHYDEFIGFFNFSDDKLVDKITLKIDGKKYPAKVRMARINNKGTMKGRSNVKYPEREVIQIFWDKEYETLKALRKFFIYSYASTIDKSKPKLKEVMELLHVKNNEFRIKSISRQETDFDSMLRFMEDKNLFGFWREEISNKKRKRNIFVDYSRKWIPASKVKDYSNRNHIIYLLYHSEKKQLYVGKANIMGDRVQQGKGRIGLDKDWDKFMFFEIHPEFSHFIEQIEAFTIRSFAALMDNDVDITPLVDRNIKLVNRQLKK
jgi:hypothetical protein